MDNCPACKSLAAAVKRAQAEGNDTKTKVMQSLFDGHRKQHQPPVDDEAVVVWKDGKKWIVTHI